MFSCTRLIAAEGNCSECFPLGEKPCCLQSESVEPMVSIKKYGTSSVAMEINSMEAEFKPQEDIIKCFWLLFQRYALQQCGGDMLFLQFNRLKLL